MSSFAERDAPPESRHVGLIGGLGVGATVIYYRAIAAGCVNRGVVPRITIVHADAPTGLAHIDAGRIDELADYLASFVVELRNVGSAFFAIPAVTPHIALGPLAQRGVMPIVDMLEVTARRLRERGFSRIALFGTRFTIETALFGRLDDFDVIAPRPREIDGSIASTSSSRKPVTPPRRGSRGYATSLRQSAAVTASTPSCSRGPTST